MTTEIKVVDLFTGVGGAFKGYERAGMRVVAAVDIQAQPDHPNPEVFVQADAVKFLRLWAEGKHRVNANLIHLSPPCQHDAAISRGTNKHLRHTYPDLYPRVKPYLERLGIPYVIENPAARPDVTLCGEMFGLQVIRHRRFELGGWSTSKPDHVKHRGRVAGMRHGVWYEGPYFAVYGCGGGKGTVPQWKQAMGIDWTDDRKSIAEAIPPAYTQWIGERFLAQR